MLPFSRAQYSPRAYTPDDIRGVYDRLIAITINSQLRLGCERSAERFVDDLNLTIGQLIPFEESGNVMPGQQALLNVCRLTRAELIIATNYRLIGNCQKAINDLEKVVTFQDFDNVAKANFLLARVYQHHAKTALFREEDDRVAFEIKSYHCYERAVEYMGGIASLELIRIELANKNLGLALARCNKALNYADRSEADEFCYVKSRALLHKIQIFCFVEDYLSVLDDYEQLHDPRLYEKLGELEQAQLCMLGVQIFTAHGDPFKPGELGREGKKCLERALNKAREEGRQRHVASRPQGHRFGYSGQDGFLTEAFRKKHKVLEYKLHYTLAWSAYLVQNYGLVKTYCEDIIGRELPPFLERDSDTNLYYNFASTLSILADACLNTYLGSERYRESLVQKGLAELDHLPALENDGVVSISPWDGLIALELRASLLLQHPYLGQEIGNEVVAQKIAMLQGLKTQIIVAEYQSRAPTFDMSRWGKATLDKSYKQKKDDFLMAKVMAEIKTDKTLKSSDFVKHHHRFELSANQDRERKCEEAIRPWLKHVSPFALEALSTKQTQGAPSSRSTSKKDLPQLFSLKPNITMAATDGFDVLFHFKAEETSPLLAGRFGRCALNALRITEERFFVETVRAQLRRDAASRHDITREIRNADYAGQLWDPAFAPLVLFRAEIAHQEEVCNRLLAEFNRTLNLVGDDCFGVKQFAEMINARKAIPNELDLLKVAEFGQAYAALVAAEARYLRLSATPKLHDAYLQELRGPTGFYGMYMVRIFCRNQNAHLRIWEKRGEALVQNMETSYLPPNPSRTVDIFYDGMTRHFQRLNLAYDTPEAFENHVQKILDAACGDYEHYIDYCFWLMNLDVQILERYDQIATRLLTDHVYVVLASNLAQSDFDLEGLIACMYLNMKAHQALGGCIHKAINDAIYKLYTEAFDFTQNPFLPINPDHEQRVYDLARAVGFHDGGIALEARMDLYRTTSRSRKRKSFFGREEEIKVEERSPKKLKSNQPPQQGNPPSKPPGML